MSTLATITSVEVTDNDEIFVTISETPRRESRELRYRNPGAGVWVVPSEGDVVEVTELADGSKVAHAPRNIPGFGAPNGLSEGDIAIRLNEDTLLYFNGQSDGTYDVTMKCDGDLTLEGAEVFVTEGGTTEKIATESHVHEHDDSTINDTGDGSGSKSTSTKQTTAPINGLTEVEVD